jgi:Holliday junction resolvasome RuvABC endonuclease subunit
LTNNATWRLYDMDAQRRSGFLVCGFDPGFAATGWAVMTPDLPKPALIDFGVIHTKKAVRKLRRTDEDNLNRIRQIHYGIENIFKQYQGIVVTGMESLSFPRNASVSAKIAMAWAIAATNCTIKMVNLLLFSPQEVKIGVGLQKTASKEEVENKIVSLINTERTVSSLTTINKGDREHIFDAMAIAYLAVIDPSFLSFRRMTEGEHP